MKIIQVINAFFPCKIWGGPPKNVLTLSKGLQARGHDVRVLTNNILDHKKRIRDNSFTGEWDGISVTYLKAYWWGKRANSLGFIVAPDLWRYRYLIKNADIIHIHGYRHFLFLGTSLLASLYGKPIVFQPRGSLTGQFGRTWLKRSFDCTIGRRILQSVAGIVSLSQEEELDAQKLGVSQSKITRILNPIDTEECPQLPNKQIFRQKWNIGSKDRVVLFLSRLHEKKGLDLLVEAFAKIKRRDIYLCIVGPDDGFLAKAQRLVAINDLGPRVIFTGPLYGLEKYEAYRAADIYVLPTRGSEGLPTTLIEACYAGIPVIVTKTTEAATIFAGKAGLAVDFNVDALEKAIITMLFDSASLKVYSEQTQSVLEKHFSLASALDRYEEFYAQVLSFPKNNGSY